MKINVSETTTNQLNWLVATIVVSARRGGSKTFTVQEFREQEGWHNYATEAGLSLPLIEGEPFSWDEHGYASLKNFVISNTGGNYRPVSMKGQTFLIAVMRCYVVRELGAVVEVPDELVTGE